MSIESVLREESERVISREEVIEFADIVHDYSPAHREMQAAAAMGFEDTPVVGVQLAALGAKISSRIVRDKGASLNYIGQKVTFKNPVYPGEKITWRKKREIDVGADGEVKVYLEIPGDTGTRVQMESTFSPNWPVAVQEDDKRKLVYNQSISITPQEVADFYRFRGEDYSAETVPPSLGIARIPSTLLSLLTEVNRITGGTMYGTNRKMESRMFGAIKPGEARVNVYFLGGRQAGNSTICEFSGELYQEGSVLIHSDVTSLINGRLDIGNVLGELERQVA